MRPAVMIMLSVTLLVSAAGSAAAVVDIERKVERLADQMQAKPSALAGDGSPAEDASTDNKSCRWLTQVLTHQGVSHTRRVKVCQDRSWWSNWLSRAKRAN